MPSYFKDNYGDYKLEYSIGNAVIVSACGFSSSIIGGYVSDKYEQKGIYMIKAYVCIFSGIFGIPTIMGCTLIRSNFWISISSLALEYLVAECWGAPNVTMILNTISAENKGFAVSGYIFCCTIAGTISTILLGWINKKFDSIS
jgi:MFS family permease